MRTLSRTPPAAMVALTLLAVPSACAPGPRHCPPQPDRFDRNHSHTRENHAEAHPAMAVAAVAITAAGMLAGHRCD